MLFVVIPCTGWVVTKGLAYGDGVGGSPFDDSTDVGDSCPIYPSMISFAADHLCVASLNTTYKSVHKNSTQLRYDFSQALEDVETLTLDTDEWVIKVNGITGGFINALQFHTNKGRQTRLVGVSSGTSWSEGGGGAKVLSYFNGRYGDEINQIQLNFVPADPGKYISLLATI
ncbi:unnamed protein product [Didymodactylos carnosus]|uniref:Jacalin-type lectin domain-containing protein n=1 Tax=Didymodactylos carnosus TaxID=1234261 RepID=A0A814R4W1_9BILA|nr:unnamed protein product [Didymodactylos carnosus]CAF1246192.1 unnamed protein product [Didymodactylos carnosus]CAF3892053.1 unnamed protein product [Didymodactylos carnosus]CAF4053833.1 unnamed protein product [Didymodactylos carnosus]